MYLDPKKKILKIWKGIYNLQFFTDFVSCLHKASLEIKSNQQHYTNLCLLLPSSVKYRRGDEIVGLLDLLLECCQKSFDQNLGENDKFNNNLSFIASLYNAKLIDEKGPFLIIEQLISQIETQKENEFLQLDIILFINNLYNNQKYMSPDIRTSILTYCDKVNQLLSNRELKDKLKEVKSFYSKKS